MEDITPRHVIDPTAIDSAVHQQGSSPNFVVASIHGRPLKLRGWAKLLLPATAELLVALVREDVEAVKESIHKGADTNAVHRDRWKTTALHLAALHAEPDALLLLLEKKPLLVPNDNGQTAFHAAARQSKSALALPLLLMTYGPCNTTDIHGRSYLHELMENRHLTLILLCQVTEHMLKLGEAVFLLNVRDRFLQTVLDVAIRRQKPHEGQLHALLLRFGAKRGVEVDHTEREVALHDEQRLRSVLAHEEVTEWKHIAQLHRTELEHLETVLRRRRQAVRLVERESLERHDIGQQWQTGCVSIAFARQAEKHSMERMSAVMLEDMAATRLQAKWKQVLACRVLAARRTLQQQKTRAALVIQRCWRTHWYKHASLVLRKQTFAAQVLQRWYRGIRRRRFLRCVLSGELKRQQEAAMRIWVAYRRYRSVCRLEAMEVTKFAFIQSWCDESFRCLQHQVITLQACFRAWKVLLNYKRQRAILVQLQRRARVRLHARQEQRTKVRNSAVEKIKDALEKRKSMNKLRAQMRGMLAHAARSRVTAAMAYVTRLLWREVLVSLYRGVLQKSRRWWWPGGSSKNCSDGLTQGSTASRGGGVAAVAESVQLSVLLTMLVLFVAYPRGSATSDYSYDLWWGVDVGLLAVLFLCSLVSIDTWSAIEMCVLGAAAACILTAGREASRVVSLLLLLKAPFTIRKWNPAHHATDVFCTCADLACGWLVRLAPISLAAMIACVRSMQHPSLLMSECGRFSAVLFALTQPQSSLVVLRSETSTIFGAQLRVSPTTVWDEQSRSEVMQYSIPVVPIAVLWTAVWLHVTMSMFLGVTQGFHRRHVEREGQRFSVRDRRRLRRAHVRRIEEQSLGAIPWEDDIAAAKSAIESSYYDHNAVHVNAPVQSRTDGVAVYVADEAPSTLQNASLAKPTLGISADAAADGTWDLRNESDALRSQYDMEILTAALTGFQLWKSTLERFWFRQWNGRAVEREMHVVVLMMVALSIALPGVFWMEVAFSLVLVLELLMSAKSLGVGFVVTNRNGFGLLNRLFCIFVGFVPQARAFTPLRCSRLLEGWRRLFHLSAVHLWCFAYALAGCAVLWGIGVVAVWQQTGTWVFPESSPLRGTNISANESLQYSVPRTFVCVGAHDCLLTYSAMFFLPSVVVSSQVDPVALPPVANATIVAFRLLLVPFLLALCAHSCVDELSTTSRFLQFLVLRIHSDVVRCWQYTVVEAQQWFEHRRVMWDRLAPSPAAFKRRAGSSSAASRDAPRVTHLIAAKMLAWARRARSRCGSRGVLLRANAIARSSSAFSTPGLRMMQRSVPRSLLQNFLNDNTNEAIHLWTHLLMRWLPLHLLNSVLTIISLGLLWASAGAYPHYGARDAPLAGTYFYSSGVTTSDVALSVTVLVIHALSALLAVVLIPRDASCVLTVLAVAALLVALVGHNLDAPTFYSARYLSFLRLLQLQVWGFSRMQQAAAAFVRHVAVRCVMPLLAFLVALSLAALSVNAFFHSSLHGQSRALSDVSAEAHAALSDLLTSTSQEFYSALHFYVLPLLCLCSAAVSTSQQIPYNTRSDAISDYPVLHADPLVVARPLWLRGSRRFCEVAEHLHSLWLLLFVGVWPLLIADHLSYETTHCSSAATQSAYAEYVYRVGEIVGCSGCVLLGVVSSLKWLRRLLFSLRCRVGSNALSGRPAGDDLMRRICACDGVQCTCTAVATFCWAVLLYAAVNLFASTTDKSSDWTIGRDVYGNILTPCRCVFLLSCLPRSVWRLAVFPHHRRLIGLLLTVGVLWCCSTGVIAERGWFGDTTGSRPLLSFAERYSTAFHWLARYVFASSLPFRDLGGFSSDQRILDADSSTGETWLLSLAIVLKVILALLVGELLGVLCSGLRSVLPDADNLSNLPEQAVILHEALVREVDGLASASLRRGYHPSSDLSRQRTELLETRYYNLFSGRCVGLLGQLGIPRYLAKQLLEEVGTMHPATERRRYSALIDLIGFLPLLERRAQFCEEYCNANSVYSSGGPGQMPFAVIPSYVPDVDLSTAHQPVHAGGLWVRHHPRASPPHRRAAGAWRPVANMILASRLVQAVAWCESEFPTSTSIQSMRWLDFFVLHQQHRAAVLLQSLWRMYRSQVAWESMPNTTRMQRMLAATLRQSQRVYQERARVRLFSAPTIEEAIERAGPVYSVNPFHEIVAKRFHSLAATSVRPQSTHVGSGQNFVGRVTTWEQSSARDSNGASLLLDASRRAVPPPPSPSKRSVPRPTISDIRSSAGSPFASRMEFRLHRSARVGARPSQTFASEQQNRRYAGLDLVVEDSASAPASPAIKTKNPFDSANSSASSSSSSDSKSSRSSRTRAPASDGVHSPERGAAYPTSAPRAPSERPPGAVDNS